jgi:hypothetical protein
VVPLDAATEADGVVMESFWSSRQNELLDLKGCATRTERPSAMIDHTENRHNRQIVGSDRFKLLGDVVPFV